jgi:wyosine [tRNA(Phe)-imidazoG37] synthetase (radical SAM superfamily)
VHYAVLRLFADYRAPGGRELARFSIVYGPLRSRRRGLSLGINTFPGLNVCSFRCVYCFRGGANIKTLEPMQGSYNVTPSLLRRALVEALDSLGDEAYRLEAIDFSGNGEPTLHPQFSELVEVARSVIRDYELKASLGVITNSTRLCSPRTRRALDLLDHVEAKLDTVIEWKYELINQPEPAARLGDVLECLRLLRGLTPARVAVQTMLLEYGGVRNYGLEDAEAMSLELSLIEPDIVHLYTSYAPTRVKEVRRAPRAAMEAFAEVLKSRGLKVMVYPE